MSAVRRAHASGLFARTVVTVVALALVMQGLIPGEARARSASPDFTPAQIVAAAVTPKVLLLRSTLHDTDTTKTDGTSSIEAQEAAALGYAVEIVDDAGWRAKTAAQFSAYRALILGDPNCVDNDTTPIAAANDTKSTWGPVTLGNVLVIGTDPVYHALRTSDSDVVRAGARKLVNKGISFAASAANKTGMYVALSCYYHSAAANTPVPVLDAFETNGFTVASVGARNDVHIVATHPALQGLTDTDLSNWNNSVHEAFGKWPSSFEVLAIARATTGATFTASDGSTGIPYILARGVIPVRHLALAPATATKGTGSAHTLSATLTIDGAPGVGKAVTLSVAGANAGAATTSGTTDASGVATLSYTGTAAGTDTVTASFAVEGTTHVVTATASVEWLPSDLTGIASCTRTDPAPAGTVGGVLPGATVQLYSGTALVATDTANLATEAPAGAFRFTGLAPSSLYTLRYNGLNAGRRFLCGVDVTTNIFGGGVAPATPAVLNRGNHSWRTAFPLTSGAQLTDLVLQQAQSTWYKIPVAPGQLISVEAFGFSRDYQVVLYRDIAAILAEQTSGTTATADDVRYIQAGVSPGDFGSEAPGDFGSEAPGDFGSEAPGDFGSEAPGDFGSEAPGDFGSEAPGDFGSEAPGDFGSEAPGDFGSEAPGDFGSEAPGDVTVQEYTSAINAAFVARSFNAGLSPENLARQTWNDGGHYYIRVFGRDGAYDPFTPFTVRATVGAGACAVSLSSFAPTTAVPAGTLTPTSLVLVDTSRLKKRGGAALDAATAEALVARLGQFGTVVDLAADTGVQSAMTQWLTSAPTCSAAANIAVNAIKGIVDQYRTAGGTDALEYLTIVGGDQAIPYRRVPDGSPKASEENYRPPLLDASPGNASLRQAQVLTDDYYGTLRPAVSTDASVDLPDADVAIGRLVEHYEDVLAMLDAYDAVGGVNDLNAPGTKRALVTGYDFFADESNIITADLVAAGPGGKIAVDTLIEAEGLGPAHPTAWTADDLRAKLAQRYEIIALNAHFASQFMRAADWSRFDADEIASVTDGRYRNTLLLSSGCHSAYNIQGPDAIPGVTLTMDFPQAAARQGMVLVGGTGYQYGGVKLLNYTEILLTDLTRQLRYGSGPVSVGKALTAVKRDYRARYSDLNLMDHKTLNELTLYGLPMWGIDLPAAGRLVAPTTGPVTGLQTATSLLKYKDFAPGFTLAPNTVTGNLQGTATPVTATYFTIDGGYQSAPFEPVLPRKTVNASAGPGYLARGVTLHSADYTDITGFRPFADVPATEARSPYPPFVSSVFHPLSPVGLNSSEQLVLTPFQYVSTGTGPTGTARRYTDNSITARVWYSSFSGGVPAALLAGPPVIHSIAVTKSGPTSVDVSVRASGLGDGSIPGVQSVLATYTGTSGALYGKWRSLELTRGASVTTTAGSIDTFTGTITDADLTSPTSAENVRLFIQAVGANALVTTRTSGGSYYRVITETATSPAPKAVTSLQITSAPANVQYGQRVKVSASLTDASGAAVSGKSIRFTIGEKSASATTGANGTATAVLLVTPEAGPAQLSASFREDLTHLGDADARALTVSPASVAFLAQPLSPIAYSDRLFVAGLVAVTPDPENAAANVTRRLADQPVAIEIAGRGTVAAFTDAYGRLVFDTLDLGGIAAGPYNVTLRFCPGSFSATACTGDTRYGAATLPLAIQVVRESAGATFTAIEPQATGSASLRTTVTPVATQPGGSADRSAGDLRKAVVRYVFTPDPSGFTPAPIDAAVAADGSSTHPVPTLAAGVYPFTVTVVGDYYSSAGADGILVVFDPSAGFVTGGGWITSPPGAYAANAALTGRATFGFVSKYQKGANTPTGNTEFQFKVAGLTFKSSSYEWLVVAGSRAQYKGVGTINGAGNYGFLLTAIDGQLAGSGVTDKFRIKIWDKNNGDAVVYDNKVGAADDSSDATDIGGGSIVIHKN